MELLRETTNLLGQEEILMLENHRLRINWNQEYFWEIIFMNGKNLVWSSTSGKGILKINRKKLFQFNNNKIFRGQINKKMAQKI
jgi:hypothetical protein